MKFIDEVRNALTQSLHGLLAVMQRPGYIALAIGLGLILSVVIYFSINYRFYGSLLLSPMALGAKAGLIGTMVAAMSKSYFTEYTGALLLALSLLQGTALALLIYNFRRNRKFDAKSMTGGGLAAIAAVIGLGCVSCGTSLLIPLMTVLFASSAPALIDQANLVVLFIAGLLSLYAVYKMGRVSYTNYLIESVEGEIND